MWTRKLSIQLNLLLLMATDQIMKIGHRKLKQYNKQSQCPFNTVSQSGRNKSDYGGKDL